MLTKKELRRLAQEARVLAMECVEGTAPEFGTGIFVESGKPKCALGHVGWRFGWRYLEDFDPLWNHYGADTRVVVSGNDVHRELAPLRRERVVFPLLALADALEDASKASPQPMTHTDDRCDCGDYPLDEVPPSHRCEEDDEPELSTAEEIGAGSYLGWGNSLP